MIVSGILLLACEKKEPETKAVHEVQPAKAPGYGGAEIEAVGEKAKEVVGAYGEKAEDAAAGYGEKAQDTVQDAADKAKEAIGGYGK